MTKFAFGNKEIDTYDDPEYFFKNVDKYQKNTKRFIDNNYVNSSLEGFKVAEKLHEKWYTKLYLLSGEFPDEKEMPPYLTLVEKGSSNALKDLANKVSDQVHPKLTVR